MLQRWCGIGCNGCDATSEILPTAFQAWRAAERAGWTREARRDTDGRLLPGFDHYCGECSQQRRRPEGVEGPFSEGLIDYCYRKREQKARGEACETIDGKHGETDTSGRCPYCRQKVAAVASAPTRFAVSELTLAYERTYDPDWDG